MEPTTEPTLGSASSSHCTFVTDGPAPEFTGAAGLGAPAGVCKATEPGSPGATTAPTAGGGAAGAADSMVAEHWPSRKPLALTLKVYVPGSRLAVRNVPSGPATMPVSGRPSYLMMASGTALVVPFSSTTPSMKWSCEATTAGAGGAATCSMTGFGATVSMA